MNKLIAILALCTAATAQAADFTGFYAPANWTTTTDGNGSVLKSSSFVAIVSPTNVPAGGYSRYTITAPAAGTVSFDWNFYSSDDPQYESFGYLLNGLFSGLTSTSNAIQAGSGNFLVKTGDVFGFAGYAVDDLGGSATSYVFNFNAPVPEIGTSAMWATGGVLIAAIARRRRKLT